MSGDSPNELHAFLPRRQDELVRIISQLRERLSPKAKELAEVCELMDLHDLKPLTDQQASQQPSKEPTFIEFVRRRHWSLSKEANAIMGGLTPKEQELENVQAAMQKLGVAGAMVRLDALPGSGVTVELEAPTIKELILDALRDHFRDGATGTELSQHFLNVHGRDIDRTSISPQLTRLREDGVVEQLSGDNEGKWALKVYSHPIEKVLADEYAEAQSREEPQKIHRRKIGP
jgi:DNA-binding transcriptional ArsR family regulator